VTSYVNRNDKPCQESPAHTARGSAALDRRDGVAARQRASTLFAMLFLLTGGL